MKINFETPLVPNFIRVKSKKDWLIPVEELTLEELRKIGEEWTDNLIKKARKKAKRLL